MPLLNKRLLHDTVTKYKHEVSSTTKQDLQALFKDTLNRIDSGKFKKEESEKVPFLQRLFELLGYKLHENLEFEYSTQGRSIDGVLGLQSEKGRDVEVAIEWKGIDTKNLNSGKAGETPVSQMWDYMGKVGAEIGIVGNFLEFRIYTLKTKQTEYQEYFLRELANQDEKLDEFIFILKKQILLRNDSKQSFLETLISQSEAQQEQITKRFYNDYKQRRLNLFQHLVETNLETNKHLLLEKSQKILDRLVFIMFCEDSSLIPSGTIKNTYTQARESILPTPTKIWDFFKGLFLAIDKGNDYPKINAFNGGLFAEDNELNSLIIKDSIWQDLIKLAEYDFESDLNVNILGHIFEQSISDIEEIKNEIEGEDTDKKKSKRKKDGIYYTPEYITDYIVSETIGNWLNQESNQLETIKVLDPAGGSGAFPNQVHNYLARKHVEQIKDKAENEGFDPNLVDIDEKVIDKSILKNNIFMVDLQPESVEIAKLSLWLKTAKKDQKLNNLDENVKCGNSLINDPELAGNSAFDWDQEFPEVMAGGGFDVIVGNPPYVNGIILQESQPKQREWLKANYQNLIEKWDLYIAFIEKGLNLLKQGGYLSFIIPDAFLTEKYASRLRQTIVENYQIIQINHFPNIYIFENVGVHNVILIIKKDIPKLPILHVKHNDLAGDYEKKEVYSYDKAFNDFNHVTFTFDSSKYHTLGDICYISVGLVLNADEVIAKGEFTKKDLISNTETDTHTRRIIEGEDVDAYLILNNKWVEWGTERVPSKIRRPTFPELHQINKIVTNKVGDLEVAFDNQGFVCDQTVRSIIKWKQLKGVENASINNSIKKFSNFEKDELELISQKYDYRFLLGILNSQYIKAVFKSLRGERSIDINPLILRQIPIPKATTEEQTQIAELVDQIMALKGNSQNLTNIFLKLIIAKYKPTTISTKLKNWHKLEIADFLDELKKQKAVIGGLSAESELMAYFDEQKAKVLELEKEVEMVDLEIEGLVRGLYNV